MFRLKNNQRSMFTGLVFAGMTAFYMCFVLRQKKTVLISTSLFVGWRDVAPTPFMNAAEGGDVVLTNYPPTSNRESWGSNRRSTQAAARKVDTPR